MDARPTSGHERARRYARTKLIVSLTERAVTLTAVLLLILTPLSRSVAAWAEAVTVYGGWQWLLYFGVVGAGLGALGLVFDFLSSYRLEHRYGMSTQSFSGWARQQAKALLLTVGLGVPLLMGFRLLMLQAGDWWGLVTGVSAFAVVLVLVQLTPTVLMPLFFRFRRIDRPELVDEIREVCNRGGLDLEGVYQFDMSKQTRKANAAFTGLGRTRRVILGDTLLENFPLEEIRAVVAHEVGHYRHAHLIKGLFFSGLLLVLFFWGAQVAYEWLAPRLGYGPPGDLAGLPLIFLLLGVAGFLFQPASNALSRHFERQADRYAFDEGNAVPMANALRRLARQNLADEQPHRLVEFLFHSHPSIARRIAAAERYEG